MRQAVLLLLSCLLLTACTVGVIQREKLTPTMSAAPTPTPTPEVGRLPLLLARVQLAPPEQSLVDLALDRDADRLYVTSSLGYLHVLDASGYAQLAMLPHTGYLTLDAAGQRLYVSSGWGPRGQVTVVDTSSLSAVGTITGSDSIALDTTRNRLHVGGDVYDGTTLEKVGELSQEGRPAYNPLRDELYLVAETVYRIDPETWQVTGDLLPEISAQACLGCTGNLAASAVYVHPERNLLVVDMFTHATSGGPGYVVGPRFFDGTTLEEITDAAGVSAVRTGCGRRLALIDPVDGRTYRHEQVLRYVSFNNLMVYGPDGALETWRDGLAAGVTNAKTDQIYVGHGDHLLVLDLPTLTPLGTMPATCIHTLDQETGTIYAFDDRDLVVFLETGGTYEPAPAGMGGPLPSGAIRFMGLSPAYPADQTLFLGSCGTSGDEACRLHRSTDGGQTWVHLHGGLPRGDYLALDAAISPEFGADRTLFVSGYERTHRGHGVYRSTDGGDTWQPMWHGLTHLRVQEIVLSPDYGSDGTLLAYTAYNRVLSSESGRSIFRSSDRGLSWSLVMTETQHAALPDPQALLLSDLWPSALHFRVTADRYGVERTTDGGVTWERLAISRLADRSSFVTVLPSPEIETDHTVYVLSQCDLFRSTDDGDTWQRMLDDRLAPGQYSRRILAAAISPRLDDGHQHMFIGTAAGDLWELIPADLEWEPVEIAPQWSTVLQGEYVNELAIAPDGDVWLGVRSGGLVRFSEGAIRARYTVTEGLPSNHVSALAVAADGAVWVGTELPAGVAHFDGTGWVDHPLAEGQASFTVWDVAPAPDGTIWAGTDEPGVLRSNGQTWERITDPADRIGYLTLEIEVGPDGTLWCATPGGLALYRDGGWSIAWGRHIVAIEFGPDGSVYIIDHEDPGVWRYADGRWTSYPVPGQNPTLGALYVASDGAVWLGTRYGAFRFDGQEWQRFTAQDGLPDNEVVAIAEDADGRLWFGTAQGAARVDQATLALTPVVWPSSQASPTAIPVDAATPEPARCDLPVDEGFVAACGSGMVASRLGCPQEPATTTWAAYQPFERGHMFWREDWHAISVLRADGYWEHYGDVWDESEPESDPSLVPPEGLVQPVRGFGLTWRMLGGPESRVGWALEPEQGYTMRAQLFVGGGVLFTGPQGGLFVIYAAGGWERVGSPAE